MDLDFTGVESFSYIPVGVHTVKVKDAEFTKAQTGSLQLAINFEDNNGATRKMWCSLVPAALWKAKQVLEALGLTGLDGKVRLNTKTLIGRTCQITVENDANDESRQIVTRVSKLAATPVAPEAPFNAVPTQPEMTPTVQPPFPQAQSTTIPGMTPASPSEPVQAPVTEPVAAPQGNLPPWMQAAPQSNAPQGNLPPWMRQQ
jgi:hypothetical protein